MSIQTDLGTITHRYWWLDGTYYRHRLHPSHGCSRCVNVEAWTGKAWRQVSSRTARRVLNSAA